MQLKSLKNSQNGSGLLEVLIAVLVFAVGLLGFAGLQTQALRSNFETLQRSRASNFAEEAFDRMRSNVEQALKTVNNYELAFNETLPSVAGIDCNSSACTTLEMRNWDLTELTLQLADIAPDGKFSIVQDDDNTALYTVTIQLIESPSLDKNSATDLTSADYEIQYV
ncbi:MAG: type IV pilus modification protein PilV, partial [Reinekea sp.]|nr:type IV pilus modification protein PilV [Reinekea sp.]